MIVMERPLFLPGELKVKTFFMWGGGGGGAVKFQMNPSLPTRGNFGG